MADPNIPQLVTEAPEVTVKRFLWNIKGFSVSLRSNISSLKNPLAMEFNVGETLGLSSLWKISLGYWMDVLPHRSSKLVIRTKRVGGHPEAKYFICQASVQDKFSPDKNLVSVEMSPANWEAGFGTLGQMMGAANREDELAILVEFALFSPNQGSGTGVDALFGGMEALAEDYSNLLESADNSDFIIKVRDDSDGFAEIKVHKAILGARSTVFQRMLSSGMTEAETGTMTIEDLSPTCVKIMLKFIYTGKLDDDWKTVPEELVQAADKYNLPLLLTFLDKSLGNVCNIENAIQLRRVVMLHGLKIAIKNINNFIVSNIDDLI